MLIKNNLERYFMRKFRRARKSVLIALNSLKFYVNRGTHVMKLITLTFSDIMQFKNFIDKNGLNTYLTNLRIHIEKKLSGRKDFFYLWVLEVQERAVPHYHLILVLPKGISIKFPDKSNWHWGSSNIRTVSPQKYRSMFSYLTKSFKFKRDLSNIILNRYSRELFNFLRVAPYLFSLKRKIRIFGICQKLKTDLFFESLNFKDYLKILLKRKYGYNLTILIEKDIGKLILDIIVFDEMHNVVDYYLENEFRNSFEYLMILKNFAKKFI